MAEGSWVVLLGWPAVTAAFVAFAMAIRWRSRAIAVAGCLLAAPMFVYLALAPRIGWPGLAALVLLCLCAWRIERSKPLWSAMLALPAGCMLVWLAVAVLAQ